MNVSFLKWSKKKEIINDYVKNMSDDVLGEGSFLFVLTVVATNVTWLVLVNLFNFYLVLDSKLMVLIMQTDNPLLIVSASCFWTFNFFITFEYRRALRWELNVLDSITILFSMVFLTLVWVFLPTTINGRINILFFRKKTICLSVAFGKVLWELGH